MREVQCAKQSVSFTVMLKNILEILARQIFMGLRYVLQESLRLLKMWILPAKEESLLQLQLVICIIKKTPTKLQRVCEVQKWHLCYQTACFLCACVIFFSIVKCVLLGFFGKGEQIKVVNAVVVSYRNDYMDLFVRVYSSFTSSDLAGCCLGSHHYWCINDDLHCVYTTFLVWLTFLALTEIS